MEEDINAILTNLRNMAEWYDVNFIDPPSWVAPFRELDAWLTPTQKQYGKQFEGKRNQT